MSDLRVHIPRAEGLMRRFVVALALALAWPTVKAAGEDAATLLAAADAVRNPTSSFSVNIKLSEYRNGELNDSASLTVYSRPEADSDRYGNLARYTQPATEAGKLLLRNGSDLWFYDPESKASIRISAQTRLVGQASVGDVMSVNYARNYAAELLGSESVEDDARTKRAALHLRLKARHVDAPYAGIDFWIDETSRKPIKAQFRTEEGRLLKTAFYRRYEKEMGVDRPTETVIVDGLDTSWITVVRARGYQAREVPQAWLQRDYLPGFVGEER